ncbi:hypothetical protein [Phnomibacter ginsenosidimutans]|uniref:Uncharacterized protein n=1 Tax=Phnomibacter ginsenosidimutans TaxID=2676868 RepID=A0A6I6G8T6_9BACT|nr:hypothetical protein [Phnomibacter ginsenosidimutans]QGW28714.1 hypothetical protein GLV81_11935 [Phnomibacter ginsenosidimutans]
MKQLSFWLLVFTIVSCSLIKDDANKNCQKFQTYFGAKDDSNYIKWKIGYLQDRLEIKSIFKGTDSLEFRLWLPGIFSVDSTWHLVRYKLNNRNEWELVVTNFRFEWIGVEEYIDSYMTVSEKILTPDTTILHLLLANTPLLSNSQTFNDSCINYIKGPYKQIFMEYATPCSYWGTEFWSPNKVDDSCKSESDILFNKLLQGLQKQNGLEFIINYIQ